MRGLLQKSDHAVKILAVALFSLLVCFGIGSAFSNPLGEQISFPTNVFALHSDAGISGTCIGVGSHALLTASHVVEGAGRVEVYLRSGTVTASRVVLHPSLDLALVFVPVEIPFARIGKTVGSSEYRGSGWIRGKPYQFSGELRETSGYFLFPLSAGIQGCSGGSIEVGGRVVGLIVSETVNSDSDGNKTMTGAAIDLTQELIRKWIEEAQESS